MTDIVVRTPAEHELDHLLEAQMLAFEESIGGETPDSEIWNALAYAEENFEPPNARMYSYFNGIYRAYLTAKNGAWSEDLKAKLWRELQRHSPYREAKPIQKLIKKVEKQHARAVKRERKALKDRK